jgi:hypothetical protein
MRRETFSLISAWLLHMWMSFDSGECRDSTSTSAFGPEAFIVLDRIQYLLNLSDRTAVAVYIPDSSFAMPDRIVIQASHSRFDRVDVSPFLLQFMYIFTFWSR